MVVVGKQNDVYRIMGYFFEAEILLNFKGLIFVLQN